MLTAIISLLGAILQELRGLNQKGESVMGKIEETVTILKADFDKVNAALDNIVGDLGSLNSQIKSLQDQLVNAGSLSPADSAALDSVVASAQTLVDKATQVSGIVPDVPPAA